MSGHLEYFYNTLSHGLKGKIENPFKLPEKYHAFRYRADAGPNIKRESKFEDGFDERTVTVNLNTTPVNQAADLGVSNQTPKNNKLPLHKLSVHQDHLRRKSQVYMKRMSVLMQHQMIINPLNFSKHMINEIDGSSMTSEMYTPQSRISKKSDLMVCQDAVK